MKVSKVPVPLNRKQSYDCLNISLLISLRMQNIVKYFPTCFCFLNLHIGVKEMTPQINIKTIVMLSYAILGAVGLGLKQTE